MCTPSYMQDTFLMNIYILPENCWLHTNFLTTQHNLPDRVKISNHALGRQQLLRPLQKKKCFKNMYVLWQVQMIWLHQRGKGMLQKHPKDANYIKAPLLIILGRIFIINCSNHDKKCLVLFLIYAFRFPLTERKITYFWLNALKKQLLIKLLNTFLLSKETHGQALRYLY